MDLPVYPHLPIPAYGVDVEWDFGTVINRCWAGGEVRTSPWPFPALALSLRAPSPGRASQPNRAYGRGPGPSLPRRETLGNFHQVIHFGDLLLRAHLASGCAPALIGPATDRNGAFPILEGFQMGKRKWRRVRLEDLAGAEEQKRLLKATDLAKGQPEPESPEKRPSEMAQVER